MKKTMVKIKNDGVVVLRDATIFFRNFAGRANEYNRAGDRNFCVSIPDEETANELSALGWNVKMRVNPKDPDDRRFHLKVSVRFDIFPPKVYIQHSNGGREFLDETMIGKAMDEASFSEVDISIRPYKWSVRDQSGIKAYLKEMRVKLAESDFEFADECDDSIDIQSDTLPF